MKNVKCLLLACSGVRVKSQELATLGVSLPGFIERGKVIASLPSLGLLTIASFCPENWDVKYLETADTNPQEIIGNGYDVVAISSLTAQIDLAYSIARELREAGITVVMGGLHVSSLPEEALEHCSVVVAGEGEYAWKQFCQDYNKGSHKNRYDAKDFGMFDFKDARIPRYDLLDMSKYNRITVQSQRGCPRKCNFCAASHTISNYKCKPVEQVVAEINEIKKYWAHPFIELADDNTFLNRSWAKDLLKAMTPLKVRWFTETDISVADDQELLNLISKAGCYQILIGLESASAGALTAADPQGWKLRQFEKYKEAISRIQRAGVSVNGCFILGWDHDTKDVFANTARFVEELGLAEVQVTLLTPFPNTVLYQELKAQGRLFTNKFWDSCTLFDLNYVPKNMTPRELEEGLLWVFKTIYNAEATAKRKKIFKNCVRSKRSFWKILKKQKEADSLVG